MVSRSSLFLAFSFALIFVVGCGSTNGPSVPKSAKKTTPVKGEVSIDGAPTGGVKVFLVPVSSAEKMALTVDDGIIDADFGSGHGATTDGTGKFAISTYLANDGAPAGDYLVVFYWQPRAVNGVKPDAKLVKAINVKYGAIAKSDLKITIEDGKPKDLGKIELTSKK